MDLDQFKALLDRRNAIERELRQVPALPWARITELHDELFALQAQIDAALAEAAKEEK